ncbi:MAG: CDP-alcohol phosphatidyltransferase family protein [Actinomycetota bacterium]|nr:CDP-alcohol phosphatidyltransferase family protein [Actinomycetota bacterium]
MLDSRIRGLWDDLMKPVGAGLARTGIHPDVITVMGLVLQAGAAFLIVSDRLLAAGVVATLAALSDTLDGAVAKARGDIRSFGALLDSAVDRISDALFFLPLAWLYGVIEPASRSGQRWVAALAMVTVVASFLVSYVKARAEGLGYKCNTGIAERAERLILMIVGLLLNLVPLVLSVLAALSIITFFQRLAYVRAQAPPAVTSSRSRR